MNIQPPESFEKHFRRLQRFEKWFRFFRWRKLFTKLDEQKKEIEFLSLQLQSLIEERGKEK